VGIRTYRELHFAYFDALVAMIHHPESRKRAQKEIDDVVGRERLPDFDDHPKLHYLQALIKETMRYACPYFHCASRV